MKKQTYWVFLLCFFVAGACAKKVVQEPQPEPEVIVEPEPEVIVEPEPEVIVEPEPEPVPEPKIADRSAIALEQLRKLKAGDLELLRTITYEELENLILIIQEDSKQKDVDSLDYLAMSRRDKVKVIRSLLGGALNKDPQVRLVCIFALKDLIRDLKKPIPLEEEQNDISQKELDQNVEKYEKAYLKMMSELYPKTREVWYIETVHQDEYVVNTFQGYEETLLAFEEVDELDQMVIRDLTLLRLKYGNLQPESFRSLDARIFEVLTQPEEGYNPPIESLDSQVDILVSTLEHPDEDVQRTSAELLSDLYYSGDLDNQEKNKIEEAKESHLILAEMLS